MSRGMWTPKPPQAAAPAMQWPRAVGSLPASGLSQPRSPAVPVQRPESPPGAHYFHKEDHVHHGDTCVHQQGQRAAMTGLRATYRTQPRHPDYVPETPPVYRPQTPPPSPHQSSPPPLLSAAQPVPETRRVPTQQREIKSQPAGYSTRPRVNQCALSRPTSPRCICHRQHCKIMCKVCGQTRMGRVRLQCPEHPNTIHLMDFDRCPDCKAVNLAEIRSRPH